MGLEVIHHVKIYYFIMIHSNLTKNIIHFIEIQFSYSFNNFFLWIIPQ